MRTPKDRVSFGLHDPINVLWFGINSSPLESRAESASYLQFKNFILKLCYWISIRQNSIVYKVKFWPNSLANYLSTAESRASRSETPQASESENGLDLLVGYFRHLSILGFLNDVYETKPFEINF